MGRGSRGVVGINVDVVVFVGAMVVHNYVGNAVAGMVVIIGRCGGNNYSGKIMMMMKTYIIR